jgi:transposase
MERTGESWKPVSNLLAGLVPLFLVHAAHGKHGPGRKTDPAEARWLATLRRYGLLQASGIPLIAQRDLRDVTRYRTKLVQERAREVNRLQGVLERANLQLASGAAALLGVSGRARREAWRAGQADPAPMAARAKRRRRSTIPALEQALTGPGRDHHRRLLTRPWGHIDWLDTQSEALHSAMERCMATFSQEGVGCTTSPLPASAAASLATGPAPPRRADVAPPSSAAPDVPSAADLPPPLTFTRAAALLETLPGVHQRGAEMSGAERGMAMARCGTAARLAAWSGVAPGHDARAGNQRSGKTRKGNHVWRAGFTQLAHGAARTKGTSLSALYRRWAVRRGKRRALLAVAHSILVSRFPMLSRNAPSHELGGHDGDERRRHDTVDRLTSRIEH